MGNRSLISKNRIFFGAILAVLVYVVLFLVAGFEEVLRGAELLTINKWLLLLSFTLIHFTLRYIRWRRYLRLLGHRLPIARDVLIYLSGFALTTTPGKVGETWRSVYLQPFKISYSQTIGCFFAERYTDLASILLLCFLAYSVFSGKLYVMSIIVIVALFVLFLITNPRLPKYLQKRKEPLSGGIATRGIEALGDLLLAARSLLRKEELAFGIFVGVLSWGVQGLVLYAVMSVLGVSISPHVAIGIYALGLLAGAASFLPGGLGSTEAVMILALAHLGIEPSIAASATLICRIATLWFAVALGVLAIATLQFLPSRRV